MNILRNFLATSFAYFFPVTVASATADLDRAIIKLNRAEANHQKQVGRNLYIVEQANTEAATHEFAAARAARIRTKLTDLLG